MEKSIENFLTEMSNLTKNYGLIIGGCGCCGSPYLTQIDGEPIPIYENLHFDKETGSYTVQESNVGKHGQDSPNPPSNNTQ